MSLRTILYGTAAAAVLAAASPVITSFNFNPVAPAQAAAAVSFSIFYDELAPYGDWVSYRGGYVFVPASVGPDWRPYTVGRWVWTDDYGWTWVSDEPFGWAAYHYGRWALAEDIGWYWIPGSRWAPAWVSWKRSDDHVVWAPLPPDGDDPDLAINISIGAIPDYYWVAVPVQSFLSINLSVAIVDDDEDRRRIVREARDEDRVRARNDRMMNIAFEPKFIEERTGEKVPRREVRRSERPGQIEVSDEAVTIFNEEVRPERDRRPEKVKDVKEVRRGGKIPQDDQRAAEGQPEDGNEQVPANRRKQQATQGEEQPEGDEQVPADRRKKPPQQADQGDEQPVEEGVAEGPPDSPDPATTKRRKQPPQQAGQGEEQPEGQPVQRRKKPIVVEEEGEDAGGVRKATREQRRAKPAQQAAEEPEEGGQPATAAQRKRQAAEQPAQRQKEAPAQRRKQKACDPSVNPECPAQ